MLKKIIEIDYAALMFECPKVLFFNFTPRDPPSLHLLMIVTNKTTCARKVLLNLSLRYSLLFRNKTAKNNVFEG
jgi:hypothetical protein